MTEEYKEMYVVRYDDAFNEYNIQLINNRMEIIEERLASFLTENDCQRVVDRLNKQLNRIYDLRDIIDKIKDKSYEITEICKEV